MYKYRPCGHLRCRYIAVQGWAPWLMKIWVPLIILFISAACIAIEFRVGVQVRPRPLYVPACPTWLRDTVPWFALSTLWLPPEIVAAAVRTGLRTAYKGSIRYVLRLCAAAVQYYAEKAGADWAVKDLRECRDARASASSGTNSN
jgi:hypothetical protein